MHTIEGFGVFRHNQPKFEGDFYEGEFKNSQKTGFGVYFEAKTGTQYQGTWLEDEKHGFIKEVTKHKSEYFGVYEKGEVLGKLVKKGRKGFLKPYRKVDEK